MDVISASFLASSTDLGRLPPPAYAEIAFAGRSNVGKSSLINSLLGRKKLVRTSNTPGATRGINFFRVELRSGAQLDLVDLPGYGFAKRSKAERRSWGPLIEGFLESRAGLRAVVLIVDARRGLEEDDVELVEYLDSLSIGVFLVATKTDKLPAHQRKLAVEAIKKSVGRRVFSYSSETGEGRDALTKALLRACSLDGE